MLQPRQPIEEVVPCKWQETGECMLDGLMCEICESYEPKDDGRDRDLRI